MGVQRFVGILAVNENIILDEYEKLLKENN